MSTTATRIPIVSCGECRDAFDVSEWQQLKLTEKREPIGDREGAEVRECASCAGPIVVPFGLLTDAREGYFVATTAQYDEMYPEHARRPAKPRGFFRRVLDAFS